MDQPYDVLGPRQGTSDFHSLPNRQAGSVVSSVCGKYSNFLLIFLIFNINFLLIVFFFQQEFNWNSDETLFIYHHFVHKVMDNYGKQIHEWKKKWEINKVRFNLLNNFFNLLNDFLIY